MLAITGEPVAACAPARAGTSATQLPGDLRWRMLRGLAAGDPLLCRTGVCLRSYRSSRAQTSGTTYSSRSTSLTDSTILKYTRQARICQAIHAWPTPKLRRLASINFHVRPRGVLVAQPQRPNPKGASYSEYQLSRLNPRCTRGRTFGVGAARVSRLTPRRTRGRTFGVGPLPYHAPVRRYASILAAAR
jgi:hypothetical protein